MGKAGGITGLTAPSLRCEGEVYLIVFPKQTAFTFLSDAQDPL